MDFRFWVDGKRIDSRSGKWRTIDYVPLTSETPHGRFKQSGFGKDLSSEADSDYQVTRHVMVANT